MVAAAVAAMGFTLSLYIAKAAFGDDYSALVVAKLAVVTATLIAIGYAVFVTRKLPIIERSGIGSVQK